MLRSLHNKYSGRFYQCLPVSGGYFMPGGSDDRGGVGREGGGREEGPTLQICGVWWRVVGELSSAPQTG